MNPSHTGRRQIAARSPGDTRNGDTSIAGRRWPIDVHIGDALRNLAPTNQIMSASRSVPVRVRTAPYGRSDRRLRKWPARSWRTTTRSRTSEAQRLILRQPDVVPVVEIEIEKLEHQPERNGDDREKREFARRRANPRSPARPPDDAVGEEDEARSRRSACSRTRMARCRRALRLPTPP